MTSSEQSDAAATPDERGSAEGGREGAGGGR